MVKCNCKLFKELIEIKALRRSIITVCILVLALSWANSFPESKYYYDNMKEQVKEGKAKVIEVDKALNFDNDKFYIRRIINTEDKTYIRFSYIKKEQGWSFPDSSISIVDDKGNIYPSHGSGASGKMWGQEGLMSFDRINSDAKQITVKLNWFDRNDQMMISLEKAGDPNED